MMSAHEIALLIHILLFCYWIGGDVGVFYSSKFVVDPELSRGTRLVAAKIMLGCDLIPKICMSLMLTVGGLLAEFKGIQHPLWLLIGIIVLGPVWLTMVLTLHFKHNASFIPLLTKIDFYFRWLVIVSIIASCAFSYGTHFYGIRNFELPLWVLAKLLAFAFLVFCGLMIRINLKGFVVAYIKISDGNYTDEDNQSMIISLAKIKPWVFAIWTVLIFEAALGIVKPSLVF